MDKDFKMTNINWYITNGNLRIKVKANSENTEIIGYDDAGKIVIVNVAARPEGNKANFEIIKYFSRLLKKKVRIKSGLTGKEKVLKIGN